MVADLTPEVDHAERLLALADDWRERANKSTDPQHRDVMRRAAEELEQMAAKTKGEVTRSGLPAGLNRRQFRGSRWRKLPALSFCRCCRDPTLVGFSGASVAFLTPCPPRYVLRLMPVNQNVK
jgi:hypothetical protein